MPTFTKFTQFNQDLAKGIHCFGTATTGAATTGVFKVVLSDSISAAWTVIADVTQISGGGYAVQTTTATNDSTGKVFFTDVTFTATGRMPTTGTYRYAIVYNDATVSTSPVDALIGYIDYGEATFLGASGDTFLVDFNGTNGAFAIS